MILPTTKNLLRWYKINMVLPMTSENKKWLIWEKQKLSVRRLTNQKNFKTLWKKQSTN